MRLSEKLKHSTEGQGRGSFDLQPGLQIGSIRGAVLSYAQTITARFQGQTGTLAGAADIVGMSQCERFVFHNGEPPDWVPSEEVEIIAINGVPVGRSGVSSNQTQQVATGGYQPSLNR